ncbi:hypothetical protein ACXYMU_19155 [Pontibacter sp. CAU 1760]
MAWSTFFGVVAGAYAVYYVLNFLYDLFFSRTQKAPADAAVHYGMEELTSSEEQAYDLTEGEAEDTYRHEADAKAELTREPQPALRVEGQGIPLDEFLKEAKTYSNSIF